MDFRRRLPEIRCQSGLSPVPILRPAKTDRLSPPLLAIYCSVVPTAKSLYSVHPSVAMAQKGVASLKEKTGRSLDEWLKLINKSAPPTEKERRAWLKSEHSLGMNYAGWILAHASGKDGDFSSP